MKFTLIATLLLFSSILFSQVPAYADDAITGELCKNNQVDIELTGCGSEENGGASELMKTILTVFSQVIGVASVIAVIVGGIRFVVSGGDAQAVASARNTVLYALIGLAVAFIGFGFSEFVLERLFPGVDS